MRTCTSKQISLRDSAHELTCMYIEANWRTDSHTHFITRNMQYITHNTHTK